jgi:DNA processing protein
LPLLANLKLTSASGPSHLSASRDSTDSLVAALGFDPVSLDTLVERTGCAPADLQARLLELELQGDVSRLPGGLFQRVGSG